MLASLRRTLPTPFTATAFIALTLLGCNAATSTTTTSATSSSSSSSSSTTTTTTIANLTPYTDATGTAATYTTAGSIDTSAAFFQPLGTNGRTCNSCHQLNQGMTITPTALQALFTSTSGTDPVFTSIDGANCPTIATGDAAGHSLLLNSGLIRVAITLPATAQFTITTLNDPYGCATTLNTSGQQVVSVYRRPLPATSLAFLSNVMWDTRFTVAPLNTASTFSANLTTDLIAQLNDAVATHEQGTATPTTAQANAIATFELGLYTAQATDSLAGSLSASGATGAPANLAATTYTPAINDSLTNPGSGTFNPKSMTLFTAWANSTNAQQASIARGETLFNTAPMTLENVGGVANLPAGAPPISCSFCHDTPNIGNHSLPVPMDTGIAHQASSETDPNIVTALAQLSAPSLPVYRITGCSVNGAAVTYVTSDPGKALTTGLCSDINLQKVPILRGLAARPPYFHNGSATNVAQVVAFYNARFQMHLTAAQQTDLVNFLNAL